MSDSEYLYKTSCGHCGSSDANAVYSNGGTHCFSCGKTVRGDGNFEQSGVKMKKEFKPSFLEYPDNIRGINQETLQKYSYGVSNGKHCTYYYNENGDIVAEKYRDRNKEFAWSGDSKSSTMFGQNVWKPSEKIKLVITEGEIDAMSVSQAQNNQYPVISLPNGANSAKRDIKANYEYLSKFKELVLMFDNDEAGQKAALEVQAMFPPKYCKIAKLPMKDANEMLKAGKGREIINAIFQAEIHTPEEIKSGDQLLGLLDKVDNTKSYPFPKFLPILNKKSLGMRLGDLTILTGGTSSGKTTIAKQLELHFYNTTKFNSGIIHLEENIRTTFQGLVSIKMGKRLHLDPESHKDEEVRAEWTKIAQDKDEEGNYRFSILDAFGSVDTEKIYQMIRYLAQVEKCKIIYLDHISMLVSGMGVNVDDRKALDNIMTTLKSLTQELGIHIIAICHLNNNTEGRKPFEEGGVPNVNNLRGSGGIKQLADNIIATTRNQMAEIQEERNLVTMYLLKCRHTGDTGKADMVTFNSDTGLFTEGFEMISNEEQSF